MAALFAFGRDAMGNCQLVVDGTLCRWYEVPSMKAPGTASVVSDSAVIKQ